MLPNRAGICKLVGNGDLTVLDLIARFSAVDLEFTPVQCFALHPLLKCTNSPISTLFGVYALLALGHFCHFCIGERSGEPRLILE